MQYFAKHIKNYLRNRRQYIVFNDVESDLLPLHTGVPQGPILGPLLFIFFMLTI